MDKDKIFVCQEHSGVTELAKLMKERQDIVFQVLSQTMKTKTLIVIASILLTVSMAVVGFLWHGTVSVANQTEKHFGALEKHLQDRDDKDDVYRKNMSDRVNYLMWSAGENLPPGAKKEMQKKYQNSLAK